MTIVKKVPDEHVYYDWADWVDLTEEKEHIVIMGERHYSLFGEDTQVKIIKNDYWDDDEAEDGQAIGYDYDVIPELNKVFGGKWNVTELRGYSQGDWCAVYYDEEKISSDLLRELEVYIMGKVDEYRIIEDEDNPDDAYYVLIPHDVCWDGKEEICKFLGLDPNDTVVLVDDGYQKVYNYKEME